MKCSQIVAGVGCTLEAVGRYTWPGNEEEAWTCGVHRPKLESIAEALGFRLQIIPIEAPSLGPIKTLVEFRCPFCGGSASAVETVDGGRGGVVHTVPMCERFQQLGPVEFLQAARLARAQVFS